MNIKDTLKLEARNLRIWEKLDEIRRCVDILEDKGFRLQGLTDIKHFLCIAKEELNDTY